MKNRVLVTSMSMASPLGISVQQSWEAVLAGQSGVVSLANDPQFKGLKCQVGARIHPDYYKHEIDKKFATSFGSGRENVYTLANYIVSQAIFNCSILSHYLKNNSNENIGCIIANQYGTQYLHQAEENLGKLKLIKEMPGVVPAMVATQHKIRGHVNSVSMSFGGGMAAIGQAYRLIKDGYQDAVIVAGLDFNVNRNVVGGMEGFGAVNTKAELQANPADAIRPFDEARSGTVIGEGGGAMVLASEKFFRSQSEMNVWPYAELVGYSQTCDADHILRPSHDGQGMQKAIKTALHEAGIKPEQGVDLFNCHATSTPKGDSSEAECIRQIIKELADEGAPRGEAPYVTANKGNIGHLVNGAAVAETIFTIMSLRTGMVPAIKNLKKSEKEGEPSANGLNYAFENVKDIELKQAVKSSLVFGGINMALALKKYEYSALDAKA